MFFWFVGDGGGGGGDFLPLMEEVNMHDGLDGSVYKWFWIGCVRSDPVLIRVQFWAGNGFNTDYINGLI